MSESTPVISMMFLSVLLAIAVWLFGFFCGAVAERRASEVEAGRPKPPKPPPEDIDPADWWKNV